MPVLTNFNSHEPCVRCIMIGVKNIFFLSNLLVPLLLASQQFKPTQSPSLKASPTLRMGILAFCMSYNLHRWISTDDIQCAPRFEPDELLCVARRISRHFR